MSPDVEDGILAAIDGPPNQAKPGPPCSIGAVLARLGPNDAAKLRGWLDSASGWTNRSLGDLMRQIGYPVSYQQVGHHRRKECKCQS